MLAAIILYIVMNEGAHVPVRERTLRFVEECKIVCHVLLSLMVPREGFEPSEPSLEDSVPVHWTGDVYGTC